MKLNYEFTKRLRVREQLQNLLHKIFFISNERDSEKPL